MPFSLVAFGVGFGRCAFAVVSFGLFVGTRSVLVFCDRSAFAAVSFALFVGSRPILSLRLRREFYSGGPSLLF